jgi:hypothetical protein
LIDKRLDKTPPLSRFRRERWSVEVASEHEQTLVLLYPEVASCDRGMAFPRPVAQALGGCNGEASA